MSKAYGPRRDRNLTRIHEEEGVKIAAGELKKRKPEIKSGSQGA
jgi:hypothetical protein